MFASEWHWLEMLLTNWHKIIKLAIIGSICNIAAASVGAGQLFFNNLYGKYVSVEGKEYNMCFVGKKVSF